MPTLGYVIKQAGGLYHATKTAAYGGQSDIFKDFNKAKNFVNGSARGSAKIRNITRPGAAGHQGGPTTYEIYLPGEIFVFRTAQLAQSWDIQMTAGGLCVFDWGDGTSTAYTGTGITDTVTHNYAVAGTYTITIKNINPLQLIILDCSSNGLTGGLTNFSACTNMTTFVCSTNALTGTLPSFAECTSLVVFNCQDNQFTGELPSFNTCVHLTTFSCRSNQFSGTLPSFAACVDLITFNAWVNAFSGAVPSFATCVNLTTFWGHTNHFSGTLPSFATCVDLLYFDMHDNDLTGTLPSFTTCVDMLTFDISENQFSGTLPSFAGCVVMTDFNISTNAFTGTLPSFAACIGLDYFNCGDNAFSGTLPGFGGCVDLVDLYVFGNAFTGTIPVITTCVLLARFAAYDNGFTNYTAGVIPATCELYRVDGSALVVGAVDAILADFETGVAGRPANGMIDVSGGTIAAPSVAGLASKAAILAAKPAWVINNN